MLHFDIEWREMLKVGDELEATDKQVIYALGRAMRRTEATLRRSSSKGLVKLLQLRTAAVLRRRLKSVKLSMSKVTAREQGMSLWYGLNPMPVGVFKGRPRKTKQGAAFRSEQFDGAFIGKSKITGRRSVFKRSAASRLPIAEQLMPIEDAAKVYIEDEVFDGVTEIFWQHFMRDLRARVKFKIGES